MTTAANSHKPTIKAQPKRGGLCKRCGHEKACHKSGVGVCANGGLPCSCRRYLQRVRANAWKWAKSEADYTARFWQKVEKTAGCWFWVGARYKGGYGWFHYWGRPMKAHRYSYQLAYGAIPQGMWVLHRCDTRLCVNPAHLFLGTQQDNNLDMLRKGRQRNGNTSKTHCRRGHLFSEENTQLYEDRRYEKSYRHCRQCIRLRSAARWQAVKARRGLTNA